jgi:hypothetical protein
MPMMHVTANGFLVGLVAWSAGAAVVALVLAIAYNAMVGGTGKHDGQP